MRLYLWTPYTSTSEAKDKSLKRLYISLSLIHISLAVKSVLDFIIIAVMTSSMGKGCAFSAIPVFFFEGCIPVLARLISPIMTETAVAYLSLIGSVLIFCIGINLAWGKKINVANMLPAILLADLGEYLR